MQNRVSVARAPRYALLLAAASIWCACLVVSAGAVAASGAPGPQRLWRTFPLDGQGTTPNSTRPAASRDTPPSGAQRKQARPAVAQTAYRKDANSAIVLVLLVALASTVLFAEAHWAPLRRGGRRILQSFRSRGRPSPRGAPALAAAGGARLEAAAAGSPPSVLQTRRLSPFRRRTYSGGTGGMPGHRDDRSEDDAVVERLADYSLAPPALEAPPREAGGEQEAALRGRVDAEVQRARENHHALSIVAVRLQPSADVAPDFEQGAVTTAREVLGDNAEVSVLESRDDTLWLIVPGVRPKRAAAVAEELRKTLALHTDAVTVAVAGYPADAKTADGLVQHCVDAVAFGR